MKNELPEHERALRILKTQGPQPVKALASELDITVEGARFHMIKLEKEGLVRSQSVAEGRGRPRKVWSLTREGHHRFPDTHAEMTVNLITMMREELGTTALQKVVDANKRRVLSKYRGELASCDGLERRLGKLAEIRSREGYMAEYKKTGDDYLFIENHCPICEAAETCQGFCSAELDIFQEVLGENVHVVREEHIIKGARRCAYRITII